MILAGTLTIAMLLAVLLGLGVMSAAHHFIVLWQA